MAASCEENAGSRFVLHRGRFVKSARLGTWSRTQLLRSPQRWIGLVRICIDYFHRYRSDCLVQSE